MYIEELKEIIKINEINELSEIITRIKNIYNKDNKLYISFNELNIRPTFGSQLSDRGQIFDGSKWYEVQDVVMYNKEICCVFIDNKNNFFIGQSIIIKLDLYRRRNISIMHTAVHLLCGIINDDMIRGYVGNEKSKIEFSGQKNIALDNFNHVKDQFNKIVYEKRKITKFYLEDKKVKAIKNIKEYNSNQTGLIRIVLIEKMDPRVCLGTHLFNTSEINGINLLEPEKINDEKYKINIVMKNN